MTSLKPALMDEASEPLSPVVKKPPLKWRNLLLFLGPVFIAGIVVLLLRNSGMPREAMLMMGIFVLAALLWVTEALPLFATAILVVGL